MTITKLLPAIAVAALSTVALTGCPSANAGNTFSRDEALHAQNVLFGTVADVRAGKIEGTKSAVGAVAGGVGGLAVGNLFGGGKGNAIATVGGAIAGGLAGNAVEKGMTGQRALQVTVKLDINGKTIQVVQGTDIPFAVG
jgi:outer membrane lipoprotein SlyB